MVAVAQRIADDVLFPAAPATDASDLVPRELLDTLAGAGLYGAGADGDFGAVCAVQEALASGCLTTAFVWAQHHGLVRALAAGGGSTDRARWLAELTAGRIRAGVGLGTGGALPEPRLHARPDGPDWVLDGVLPFCSGWGRTDVIHVAASAPGGRVAWLITDAAQGPTLRAERLQLAALNAAGTVRLKFTGHRVGGGRLTGLHTAAAATAPQVLRLHAALALGVTARCCRLLGPTPLDDELSRLRDRLDELGPGTAAARGAAGQLAVHAAAAVMTSDGSRSLLAAGHGQRLMREAMFTLVYALRPESRAAVLTGLGARGG